MKKKDGKYLLYYFSNNSFYTSGQINDKKKSFIIIFFFGGRHFGFQNKNSNQSEHIVNGFLISKLISIRVSCHSVRAYVYVCEACGVYISCLYITMLLV